MTKGVAALGTDAAEVRVAVGVDPPATGDGAVVDVDPVLEGRDEIAGDPARLATRGSWSGASPDSPRSPDGEPDSNGDTTIFSRGDAFRAGLDGLAKRL